MVILWTVIAVLGLGALGLGTLALLAAWTTLRGVETQLTGLRRILAAMEQQQAQQLRAENVWRSTLLGVREAARKAPDGPAS